MNKILIIAPKTKTLINFRKDLIKDFLNYGYEVVTVSPEEGFEKQLNDLGVKSIILKMDKNSTSIFSNIKYWKELTKIVKKENPDKIFSYTIKPNIFGAIAGHKCKIEDVYSMVTGVGYVYTTDSFKARILQIICGLGYKIAFKYSKKVIFQNIDDLELFVNKKYLNKDKSYVVDGSGVNTDRFMRKPLPEEDSFVMISRLLKPKGVCEYFEAAKLVKEKYPNTKFLFVGGYSKTQYSVDYELIDREYFKTGIIDYCGETNDITQFVKQARVFVLPSYYGEGIPRTLLEALAMARPVITTNNRGCKETVKDGVNGFIVPVKDPSALAEKMIYMIEHRDELDQMAEESYKYCKERFDIEIINKKMLEIMEI